MGDSFVRPSSRGKASLRNSSRRMRRSSLFTTGKAPTPAERSTNPPARATLAGKENAPALVWRVPSGNVWATWFGPPCIVSLRTPCDSLHRVAPRGRAVARIGVSSQQVNVHRDEKSRNNKTPNSTYEKCHGRKLSATRLTSMARDVSIFFPLLRLQRWTLPRHIGKSIIGCEKKQPSQITTPFVASEQRTFKTTGPENSQDIHGEMCGKCVLSM